MEKIKYFKVKDSTCSTKINVKQVLKGVIGASVAVILLMLLAAALFTYSDISASWINTFSNVVFYVGAFISGLVGSRKVKSYGWLHGVMAGAIYVFMIICLNLIANMTDAKFQIPVVKILLSILLGGIGGIVGVNLNIVKKK